MHKILLITIILIGFEIQDNWAMVPSIPNPLIPNPLGADLPVLNPNSMKSSMWIQPPFCQQGPGSNHCYGGFPMFTYNATEGKVKSSYVVHKFKSSCQKNYSSIFPGMDNYIAIISLYALNWSKLNFGY